MIVHFDFCSYYEKNNNLRFKYNSFDSLIDSIVRKFKLNSWCQVVFSKVPDTFNFSYFPFSNKFYCFVSVSDKLNLIGVGAIE